MGEDKNYELVYCLHIPRFGSVITSRGQNLIYRKMYDEFLRCLRDKNIKIKSLPQVHFGNNDVNASVVTGYGRVDVIRERENCLTFGFCKNIDLPRSAWRAGELAHQAIIAVSRCYNEKKMDLAVEGGKCVRDLVVVNVRARLGRQEKEVVSGIIPLHYRNGMIIRSSEREIGLLEQEVADELLLESSNKNPVVKYRTGVSYAWHEKHGIVKGRVPKGLETRIIRSGVLTSKTGASNT